jgi:glycosyltransferase involved in cell wall biosynthesis
MKDVLIITSYYPPEIGAASNRIFHLAEGLKKHDCNVSVITPLPNYPKGEIFSNYKGKFRQASEENGIKVYRLWVYASNSKNKLFRLIAMLSYSFSLIWFFLWNTIPKTVIVQSPPLFVAFTCMLILKSKKRKLILNVSDLWPLAGLELGIFKKNLSYELLEKIERFNYKRAHLILGQSEEILTHVVSCFPKKETFLYRNFPDFELPKAEYSSMSSTKIKVVYAGLLGVAQGILKLCQNLDYTYIEFHIYGAGAEQNEISAFIINNPDLPITYNGELPRKELHIALLQYDITIIPLLNSIYGSVPSKIFEYAKLGIPILYFAGGEGESMVKKYNLGWIVKVGNYDDLNNTLSVRTKSELNLKLRERIKEIANANFNLKKQIEDFKKHL